MTKIEWTNETWNPILGCSKISAGCKNCYAIFQSYRNKAISQKLKEDGKNLGRLAYYEKLTEKDDFGIDWSGEIVFVPEALEIPLKRKKPTMYFVNSMSDLFHENVPNDWIDQIFSVMAISKHHTFQVLTKRPQRMRDYLLNDETQTFLRNLAQNNLGFLENVWLGTTCENQKTLDKRLPFLLETPAKVRFLSCEPLLENINLNLDGIIDIFDEEIGEATVQPKDALHWIIVGGESGHNARPCNQSWLRSIVEQCQKFNVPVFVKQLGSNVVNENEFSLRLHHRKGGDIEEFPTDLRIREFPRT